MTHACLGGLGPLLLPFFSAYLLAVGCARGDYPVLFSPRKEPRGRCSAVFPGGTAARPASRFVSTRRTTESATRTRCSGCASGRLSIAKALLVPPVSTRLGLSHQGDRRRVAHFGLLAGLNAMKRCSQFSCVSKQRERLWAHVCSKMP